MNIMKDADRLRTAEIVELLLDPPDGDRGHWAGAIIFRALESGGHCRYRHGGHRLNDASFTRLACESMVSAHDVLREAERPLFLRVMLLVPWELNVRSTGLPLRVGKVLESLSTVTKPAELAVAVKDVIESGPEAVKKLDLDEVLPEERGPGTGHVLELSKADRRKFGIAARRLEFDRLEVAVSNFQPYNWEANLRPLVPWWLDVLQPAARDRAVKSLVARVRREGASDAGRYRLLGLLDWMCEHAEHQQADDVLRLGLAGRDGATRKPAAALAAALREADVLEGLIRTDPDKGVRKRAQKLLEDLELDALF